MTDETSGAVKSVIGASVAVSALCLFLGLYWWGDTDSPSSVNAGETHTRQLSELCIDQPIQYAAKEKIALAITERIESGPWEHGSKRLREANDLVNRLTLSQISFHGFSKVGSKIGCWASVSISPLDPNLENEAYARTARIRFSIQTTMDGTDPAVSLENDHELISAAEHWAKAEVLLDPSAELNSTLLGAWKELDEDMKATADERRAQVERINAKTDLWNKRYAEVFNNCTEALDVCQQRAKAHADQDEIVTKPNHGASTD